MPPSKRDRRVHASPCAWRGPSICPSAQPEAPDPNESYRHFPKVAPLPSCAADASVKLVSYWHKANYALLGLFPLSFLLSPSSMNFPIDMGLALALPFHAHVGMNMVLTDYVKKVLGKGAVRAATSLHASTRPPSLLAACVLFLTLRALPPFMDSLDRRDS